MRDKIILPGKVNGVKSLLELYDGWSLNESYHVLAVENLKGIELCQYIQETVKNRKRFGEDDLRRAISDVFKGLNELHNHHILHLDLKPENLRYRSKEVHADGTITYSDLVILDFGQAFHHDWDTREFPSKPRGTKRYQAPEISAEIGKGCRVKVDKRDGTCTGVTRNLTVRQGYTYSIRLDGDVADITMPAGCYSPVRKVLFYSPAVDVFAMGVTLYSTVRAIQITTTTCV